MDDVICFYEMLAGYLKDSSASAGVGEAGTGHTGSEHALYKIVDIAEDDPKALWGSLLASQRLDLNTLEDRL